MRNVLVLVQDRRWRYSATNSATKSGRLNSARYLFYIGLWILVLSIGIDLPAWDELGALRNSLRVRVCKSDSKTLSPRRKNLGTYSGSTKVPRSFQKKTRVDVRGHMHKSPSSSYHSHRFDHLLQKKTQSKKSKKFFGHPCTLTLKNFGWTINLGSSVTKSTCNLPGNKG